MDGKYPWIVRELKRSAVPCDSGCSGLGLRRRAPLQILSARRTECSTYSKGWRSLSRHADRRPTASFPFVWGGPYRLQRQGRGGGHLRVSALGRASYGDDRGDVAARLARVGVATRESTLRAATREAISFFGAASLTSRKYPVRPFWHA